MRQRHPESGNRLFCAMIEATFLTSTKDAYDRNLARVRPYGYFVVANLAAFAVAVGPATAVALARLRSRATWVLVGGGLAAVVAADVSGLSLAETGMSSECSASDRVIGWRVR